MTLRAIGHHKGSITMDLDTSTVLDLKKAVSRDSGLAVSVLKLLAGGKHLRDDSSTLAQCGITSGKSIMVLRQDLSEQVQAEAGLARRTEEVAQAASMLSARAARDIDTGGRGNAWGDWGRGGRGEGQGSRGRRDGRPNNRPEMELTNQNGEAMAIPAEDSAALMEGVMLHRKGLACVARFATVTEEVSAAAATTAISTAQNKKPRRQPFAPQSGAGTSAPGARGTSAGKRDAENDAPATIDGIADAVPPAVGEQSGWEERKESLPQEMGVQGYDGKYHDAVTGTMLVDDGVEKLNATPSAGSEQAAKGVAVPNVSKKTSVVAVPAEKVGANTGVDGHDRKDVQGQGKPKPAEVPVRPPTMHRRPLSGPEKSLAQREALSLLMRAEEAFRRCNPKYLECIDNYAYLCLDIAWLLFLMKNISNLNLASRMLDSVERGFRKAHGPGLQRLTALKGKNCAEKILYVRLHLLQGVVAFLQGDSGKASVLLIRASEEAKSLKTNPALAMRLMQQWHTVKFEVLRPKVALLALRAGRNNLEAAWQYLESLRQRQETVRKEKKHRIKQRRTERFGLTVDKKGFVDASLVEQLTGAGFSRPKAVSSLRQHNNDVAAALVSLTSSPAGGTASESNNEALAVLQSLGVPPEAARDVLERTGTLCDSLRELGIIEPEGMMAPGGGGTSQSGISPAPAGGEGVDAGEDWGSSEEEGENGEGADETSNVEPTPEEKRLYEELAADGGNQDEEDYLDVTLADEADAAEMYLHLCRGEIPAFFDLEKIRASTAAAMAGNTSKGNK